MFGPPRSFGPKGSFVGFAAAQGPVGGDEADDAASDSESERDVGGLLDDLAVNAEDDAGAAGVQHRRNPIQKFYCCCSL